MAFQWSVRSEHLDDGSDITAALREDWEPFAVTQSRIYFRKHVYVEEGDKSSETVGSLEPSSQLVFEEEGE